MIRYSTLIAAALMTGISGCAQDFLTLGNMELGPEPGTYRWRTYGDMATPHDSEAAEALRMKALDKLMGKTPGCSDGYRVTDRNAVLRQVTVIGAQSHDIYYSIDCR